MLVELFPLPYMYGPGSCVELKNERKLHWIILRISMDHEDWSTQAKIGDQLFNRFDQSFSSLTGLDSHMNGWQ